jgi:hypothetical protein
VRALRWVYVFSRNKEEPELQSLDQRQVNTAKELPSARAFACNAIVMQKRKPAEIAECFQSGSATILDNLQRDLCELTLKRSAAYTIPQDVVSSTPRLGSMSPAKTLFSTNSILLVVLKHRKPQSDSAEELFL